MRINGKTMQTEWEQNFGFLKKYGMEGVYLMILALATSQRDLRTLHLLLPENCRLPRAEFDLLVRFWKGRPFWAADSRVGDEPAQWFLRQQCPTRGLTKWYLEIFNAERKDAPWSETHHDPFTKVWASSAQFDFMGKIFGVEMDLYFNYSKPDRVVWCMLRFPTSALTEPLLHKLRLSKPLRDMVGAHEYTFACYRFGDFEDGHFKEVASTRHECGSFLLTTAEETFYPYIIERFRDHRVEAAEVSISFPKYT